MKGHLRPPHIHAWHLADGTGLHAPTGELVVEEGTGRLCCHLCGGWYRSLGSHVRTHGHTADSYRAELGLCKGDPLTHDGLSAAISLRQRAAYQVNEDVRERLAAGQQQARSGELSRIAARSRGQAPLSAGAVSRQSAALAAGRRTVARRRDAALSELVENSDSPDLASYLRARYQQGANLAELAGETGLGRALLRAEMKAAGIVVRSRGHNTPGGRRSRALTADAAAAERVGTDDLVGWLRLHRDEGLDPRRSRRGCRTQQPLGEVAAPDIRSVVGRVVRVQRQPDRLDGIRGT